MIVRGKGSILCDATWRKMATPLGHQAKQLTEEEVSILAKDVTCIGDYQRCKLEREAKKNWDLFYKRNSTHFFKDRHWITREFPELIQELGKVDLLTNYIRI